MLSCTLNDFTYGQCSAEPSKTLLTNGKYAHIGTWQSDCYSVITDIFFQLTLHYKHLVEIV